MNLHRHARPLLMMAAVSLSGAGCFTEVCDRLGVVESTTDDGCTVVIDECENRQVIDMRVTCDGTTCQCTKSEAAGSTTAFATFTQADFCSAEAREDLEDTANENCGFGWQTFIDE